MTFKRFSADASDVLNLMSYFFGMLIFGNIIDNISNCKPMLLVVQLVLCIGWAHAGYLTNLYLEAYEAGREYDTS